MMRTPVRRVVGVWALAMLLGLAACSSSPPVPDWRLQARQASDNATQAYLSGRTRLAQAEWARARREAARSALPEQVARVWLAQCAAQVASLVLEPCEGLDALATDLSPDLLAYRRYLQGQTGPGVATVSPEGLNGLSDPLSRLLAAAVLWRTGQATASSVESAVATASAQGWTRPLLAWLGVQAQWAQQAGDTASEQRLRRRMDLLAPLPAR